MTPVEAPKRVSWQRRLLSAAFALFTLEVGLFLVFFPWWGDTWDTNYFQRVIPGAASFWREPSFKGAVTGLGFVNLYICLLQVARLIRRR